MLVAGAERVTVLNVLLRSNYLQQNQGVAIRRCPCEFSLLHERRWRTGNAGRSGSRNVTSESQQKML